MASVQPNTALRVKPTVFVVDDNEAFLIALSVVLRKKYNVKTMADSTEAVEIVSSVKPSVVILDVLMPGHDGFWVFQKIRAISPTVPIILNSAYQNIVFPEDIATGIRPFAYLTKEGNLQDIENAIRDALALGNAW